MEEKLNVLTFNLKLEIQINKAQLLSKEEKSKLRWSIKHEQSLKVITKGSEF